MCITIVMQKLNNSTTEDMIMNELLEFAVKAHGDLGRWNQLKNITAKMTVAGAIWGFKQKPGLLTDVTFESNIHDQNHVVFKDFAGKGNESVFRPDKLFIKNEKGETLWARDNPRNAYDATSPWDELNVAYFNGYATWNYLTQPFTYTLPGFTTEEVAPRNENGETWRGLKITYPSDIASHTRVQTSYFGKDGLLRRHDYTVDILGGATGANYASDYQEARGIMVPTKRRIYARDAKGDKVPEPLLVSIDIASISLN
jgi:hypothetical protein